MTALRRQVEVPESEFLGELASAAFLIGSLVASSERPQGLRAIAVDARDRGPRFHRHEERRCEIEVGERRPMVRLALPHPRPRARPERLRFAVAIVHSGRVRERRVPSGLTTGYVSKARFRRAKHPFPKGAHRRHVGDDRELEASLEWALRTTGILEDQTRLSEKDVRGDTARDSSKLFRTVGALGCEQRALLYIAAFQEERASRDHLVEPRDLVTLVGNGPRPLQGLLRGRELAKAGVRDREEPR